MVSLPAQLRVALLAADLSRGGAEKQLVYVARALRDAGVTLQVYTLTRGQYHEATLRAIGLEPIWVGRYRQPLLRLGELAGRLRGFRPHVIQSTHSFANLYAGLLGRLYRAISLGALRCSVARCREGNGGWTRWLLQTPTALVVNSRTALHELAESRLLAPQRIFWLPNAVDLGELERQDTCGGDVLPPHAGLTAAFVGRLIGVKRADRFVWALALAAREEPAVRGVVVGDGPQRASLEKLAGQLGLGTEQLRFLGQRRDVPCLLRQVDVLVHCSDDEGLPNAVLEAMAASLPVVTTPAGDAPVLVRDGHSGYVVPFDDREAMAGRLVGLARCPQRRRTMGQAGRREVEQHYSFDRLGDRLLSIYEALLRGN